MNTGCKRYLVSPIESIFVSKSMLVGEPRAWCYTNDPNSRWEYCDVPSCGFPTNSMASSPTRAPTVALKPTSAPVTETHWTRNCTNQWFYHCRPNIGSDTDTDTNTNTNTTLTNATDIANSTITTMTNITNSTA